MDYIELFGKSTSGKIKTWAIKVDFISKSQSNIVVTHGYLNGKKQSSIREVKSGKNIGKKNETTPYSQACAEAKSMIDKKITDNYSYDLLNIPKKESGLFLPMLAHRFDKHSNKIKYPCWVQPKLDGVRMLSKKENGNIIMWSRKGKVLEVPEKISSQLKLLLPEGQTVDGEIYVHGWNFQRIVSAVKKKCKDTNKLEYHIYDCPAPNKTFEDRFLNNNIFKSIHQYSNLFGVQTSVVDDKDSLDAMENHHALKNRYEGIMVRNQNSLYKYKDRSYDLQKVKRFEDSEFEIIGGKDGSGKESGLIIFRCISENKVEFDVRPKGSREERSEIYNNLDSYIGKKLKVSFQGRTNDGVPRFPVGIAVREEWDS